METFVCSQVVNQIFNFCFDPYEGEHILTFSNNFGNDTVITFGQEEFTAFVSFCKVVYETHKGELNE